MEDGNVTLAYIGGGLGRDDLGNLFDYLFASKDRAEIGHLRELALGINAVLLFKPERVIVESGDGTLVLGHADHIRVCQDGRSASLTAPNGSAQRTLLGMVDGD